MGKEFYNPDRAEQKRQKINNEPAERRVSKPADNKPKEKSRNGFISALTDERTRKVVGIAISLIGVYMLISFISYFNAGIKDQSIVHSYGLRVAAETALDVKNYGSVLGANVADTLVAKGVGVAAFIIVLWCLVIGWRLFMLKTVRFFSYTLVSIVSIITCSLVLDALTLGQTALFFPLGGYFGEYVNSLLISYAGYPGLAVVNIFVFCLWVFVCLNTLKKVFAKIGSTIPKHARFEVGKDSDKKNKIEITPEETEPATDKTEDEVEPSAPTESHVKDPFDIQAPMTEDETEQKTVQETPTIVGQPTPVQPAAEADQPEQEEGKIEIAPEIDQADTTKQEAYDPTKELSKFKFPSLDLLVDRKVNLNNVDIDEQEDNKRQITETLAKYNVAIKKIDACVGPTITLFEIVPEDGTRVSRIKSLEDDIALSIAAIGIRIIAPMPGKGTIGIEVPNREPQTVPIRSVLGSKKFQESKMELPMALGCTIENQVFMADLAKMPHLLVAGATGQGKSVCLNAIIASLLYKKHPSELKIVLVDPKMVEFSLYSKLKNHYLACVEGGEDECIITDSKKVVATLNSLVQEMEDRYRLLMDAQERNIKDYNQKFIAHRLNPEKGHRFLPYIVVVIDEFGDLIAVEGKEVERPIVRIAQKARAVGIHMIIATQRPTTDVISGLIKANFPGRIALRVQSGTDSRTILDCNGAQQLVGKGDMLFQTGGVLERIQCAFIDTPEVVGICDSIYNQVGFGRPYQLPEFKGNQEDGGDSSGRSANPSERDPLFEEAAMFIISGKTASTSSIQRHFSLGYNRAGRIMDQMEAFGIVGPATGGKPRSVLIDEYQLESILHPEK